MAWFVNYLKTSSIDVTDRGLTYGDGVFETLLLHNGRIKSSRLHMLRLMRACNRLYISFSHNDVEKAFAFIEKEVPQLGFSCAKIILTRGVGGRGYLPPEDPDLTLAIGIFDAPNYQKLSDSGVKIDISPVKASINTSVAGLKHLNRLENVLAKQALNQLNLTQYNNDCFESVLLDDEGYLVECIQSNLFWFKSGALYTPLLNRCGVQGTLRSQVLNNGLINVNVGRFLIDDLLKADEVFVCNRLMSLVPVVAIQYENKQHRFTFGIETKRLKSIIEKN